MTVEKSNPKQIPNPDNEEEMIDNPDYNPDLNEDGTPIKKDPVDPPKDDLAPIKASLNKAYEERDAARAEVAALKKAQRDAELEKLKAEGKDKEHFEATLSDRDAEIATLKQEIIELTRDNAVRRELTNYTFRNDRAAEAAYDSIIHELIQDEKGKWVHKSGKSVPEFIKSFAEDEDNAFFFEAKENRGSKTPPVKPRTPNNAGKSLFDLPQSEVLKMAQEGKLPKRQ